jgi:hypothetical protein
MNTVGPRHLRIFDFFEAALEPRVERTRLHPIQSILFVALLAMICAGEGWEDLEEFGNAKREWLGTCLDLRHGIPRADTFEEESNELAAVPQLLEMLDSRGATP